MRVIGTINKRVDIGYDKTSNSIYIMASSNCILFNKDELNCLMSVLSIINMLSINDSVELFYKNRIKLFEPAPPPAEIRII